MSPNTEKESKRKLKHRLACKKYYDLNKRIILEKNKKYYARKNNYMRQKYKETHILKFKIPFCVICFEKSYFKGLCSYHYTQQWKNKNFESVEKSRLNNLKKLSYRWFNDPIYRAKQSINNSKRLFNLYHSSENYRNKCIQNSQMNRLKKRKEEGVKPSSQ